MVSTRWSAKLRNIIGAFAAKVTLSLCRKINTVHITADKVPKGAGNQRKIINN